MIDKALKIDGWMTPEELRWLADQARYHSKIVEIGTFLGRSTRALADNTKGFVVTIDDFIGPIEDVINDKMRPKIENDFRQNLSDLLSSGKVISQRIDSIQVDLDFSPDMVFIDGSHTYRDVANDIFIWRERILKGGLLCGHDIQFREVQAAVKDVLGDYKIAEGTTIWYLT